jgi:hypothetical protein
MFPETSKFFPTDVSDRKQAGPSANIEVPTEMLEPDCIMSFTRTSDPTSRDWFITAESEADKSLA